MEQRLPVTTMQTTTGTMQLTTAAGTLLRRRDSYGRDMTDSSNHSTFFRTLPHPPPSKVGGAEDDAKGCSKLLTFYSRQLLDSR